MYWLLVKHGVNPQTITKSHDIVYMSFLESVVKSFKMTFMVEAKTRTGFTVLGSWKRFNGFTMVRFHEIEH